MFRFNRGTALVALAAVTGSFMSGCGTLAQVAPAGRPAESGFTRAVAQNGEQMAAEFAASLEARGLKPILRGTVVVVPGADNVPLQYDFATTVRTGKVEFTAGNFRTTITRGSDEPTAQIATWRLVLIAVRVVYGGVNAWVWYRGTHPGDDFKKAELVQAILYGMISQGLVSVPYVGLFSGVVLPIIWKWVTGKDPIRPTVAELFETARADIPKSAQALAQCEQRAR